MYSYKELTVPNSVKDLYLKERGVDAVSVWKHTEAGDVCWSYDIDFVQWLIEQTEKGISNG